MSSETTSAGKHVAIVVAAVLLLLGGCVGAVPVGVIVFTTLLSDTSSSSEELDPDLVPAQWLAALLAAGERCEGINAPLLAAQIETESSWDPAAISPAGATGLAQFMPATWATWGKDYDGDGRAEATNGYDAIGSQADYMCHLFDWATAQLAAGTVTGTPLELTLAAYNAGPGAVQRFGGIPPFTETQRYVARVLERTATYAGALAPPGEGTDTGSAIVAAARQWEGFPYVWGGGNIHGPTGGGFDCSGLTLYAVHAGTGIALPHLADAQARDARGAPIPRDLSQMLPGDVIAFSSSGGARYEHVGIYIGGGQMVHAPTFGKPVQVAHLGSSYWTGKTWSIRRFG